MKWTNATDPIWNSECAEIQQGNAAPQSHIAQCPFIITHISTSSTQHMTQHTGMHCLPPGKLISLSRQKGLLLNPQTANTVPLPQKQCLKGGSWEDEYVFHAQQEKASWHCRCIQHLGELLIDTPKQGSILLFVGRKQGITWLEQKEAFYLY